jgi:P-type E1-E2 ATPase
LAKAHEQGITIPEAQRLSIVPGQGVEAEAGGCAILVGGEQLLQDRGIPIEPPWLASLAQKRQSGHTALLVAKDGGFLGALYATDIPRPGSGEAVRQLERLGLRVVMLSGDRRQTAERIAQAVGIQEVVAEVLPGEKQAAVQRLREQGERVAMVGDGINDAPALVAADLGIAVGSGTDIAIESADLVLMREDLRSVPQAIRLARATFRTIQQNLAWAFLYNILLLPLAAGVFEPLLGLGLPPALAALAMALSSVSVVTNSLLLRFRVSRGELGNITPRR